MRLLDRITDRIAEKAAKRAFEVGLDTVQDVLADDEKRAALLDPVWKYFDKMINLKIANITKGTDPIVEGLPEGMGLPGGLGALAGLLPPALAKFAPLLGMVGGGAASPAPALSGGNGHNPGVRR